MELSINAIVTIVIALMVLGLGLGLVNGVLSFGGKTLAQSLEGYVIDIPATSDNQLVIADPLRLESSSSTVVMTSFFNNGFLECNDPYLNNGAWLELSCPDQDIIFQRQQTVPLDIPISRAKNMALVVEVASGVSSGTYLCFADVYCGDKSSVSISESDVIYSQPLFVKVNS